MGNIVPRRRLRSETRSRLPSTSGAAGCDGPDSDKESRPAKGALTSFVVNLSVRSPGCELEYSGHVTVGVLVLQLRIR